MSTKRKIFCPLLAGTAFTVPLLFACGKVHAQEIPSAKPSEAAKKNTDPAAEIIVTATRSERSIRDVPQSVSVVDSEQIRDTPAQSLDDILRRVPGVNVPITASYQAHPTADSVSMRGLGRDVSRALVMVDGIPLNDPFFGYVQWNRVPMENIDRVEVVRGGGAPLWGNYAMGGVINIISREPETRQAILDGGGGSYGTYRASGYGAYFPTDNMTLNMSAVFNGTDGFMPTPAHARRPIDRPTSFDARNIQLSDVFKPSGDVIVHGQFNYHENDQRLGTALSTNTQQTFTYSGDVRKFFDDGASLTATLFHSDSSFVTNNPHTPDGGVTEFSENVHTTPVDDTGGSLVWSQDLSGFFKNYMIGTDFHYISGTDTAKIFNATGQHIRDDIGRGNQIFVGSFVQASVSPMERLEITGSGRFQFFENFDGFDGNPGGIGVTPDQSHYSFDPRMNIRYSVTDGFALRGAYYEAFRAPTLDNLYRGFASAGGTFLPNAQLKPETLAGGEIGFDYTRPGLRSQLTFYRTEIENLTTTRPLAPAEVPAGFFFGTRNINAGSARAQGIEVETDWDIGSGVSAILGYTFADSIILNDPLDPQAVGHQLHDVPRHKAEGGITYRDPQGWRIATQLRWVSRTWENDDHVLQPFTDPRTTKAASDSHFVVDIAASYPVLKNVEAYLRIQNLFDRRYIANPGPWNPMTIGTPFEAFAGLHATF